MTKKLFYVFNKSERKWLTDTDDWSLDFASAAVFRDFLDARRKLMDVMSALIEKRSMRVLSEEEAAAAQEAA